MKKHKLIQIIVILILIITLSSCNNNSKLPITQADLYKGTEAINIDFLTNAPPEQIYETKEFRVGIDMKNNGAGENANGYLILGFEDDYLELNGENKLTYDLEGRNLNNLYGSEDKFMFEFSAKTVDQLATHHLTTIYATTCYTFKTKASTAICVDTDIYDEKRSEKTCRASDISLSDQGAPVAVTLIEQDMLPEDNDRIQPVFNIHVQNVGNGKVISAGSIDKACSSQGLSRQEDFNIVGITAKLGDEVLSCSPTPLQLISDTDYVRCTLEQGVDANFVTYQSLLSIELTYGYMYSISTEVDIKKINQ